MAPVVQSIRQGGEQSLRTFEGAGDRAGWKTVAILTGGYILSTVDGRMLSLLVVPVQTSLDLSDVEIGLLQGIALSLFFCVAALPIGRLVDRARRRGNIAAVGALCWSVMAALCGLASSFAWLFAARVGVGVGQATLHPTALSLISDYFGRERRAFPISIYEMGLPLGAGLSLLVGGGLLHLFEWTGGIDLPLLGMLEPWQLVFLCIALPGLPLALSMLSIGEPPRRELISAMPSRAGVGDLAGYVRANGALYGSLLASMCLIALVGLGSAMWFPTFLSRTYGLSPVSAGLSYGMVVLIFATAGTALGGWLAARLVRAGRVDATLRVMFLSTLVKFAPLVAAPLMPTYQSALALTAVGLLTGHAALGVMFCALQDATPNQLRGQISAISLLLISLCGSGLGAPLIAAITQYGFGDPAALRYSIALTALISLPLVLGLLLLAMPRYRRTIASLGAD